MKTSIMEIYSERPLPIPFSLLNLAKPLPGLDSFLEFINQRVLAKGFRFSIENWDPQISKGILCCYSLTS